MEQHIVVEKFSLERAINVDNTQNLSDFQKDIFEQTKKFGIDQIYFSQDEKNSYPAIFIKKVVSFDLPTLKLIADIHKKAWNYKKVLFLYVYNDTEIRIYNCIETPVFVTDKTNFDEEVKKKELAQCNLSDKERLEELNHIFSSVAIDSGIIWSIEKAAAIRKKINLQQRVDQYLVESLTWVADKLKNELEIELIHRLILSSLFLLYMEDRKATDKQFYAHIQDNAESYFDILKDVNATYLLFEKLEKHFNGNVFSVEKGEIKKVKKEHLSVIRQCFISGYLEAPLFPDWRLFDFSIIQIELISQIYETFLAKVTPGQKKASGVYYTPPALVELILNEKLPVNGKETQYKLKILDPACGSGIFLVESFKRLVKRYENARNIEKLTDFETLKKLLTDNIYGIECDSNAIKVAAFSLYLALVDCLDPKTLWQGKKLPFLINDPYDKTLKEQGGNLYKRDTIEENKEIERISFDLVVGNPPFGTETKERKLPASIRDYCNENQFAKEMVFPFLHKAVRFAPKGEIAMIFNTKILTNTQSTYQNFRKWLMQKCYVEKVYNFSILRKAPKDFGGQLFGDAVGPISIVFYRKEPPLSQSKRIVYYAPKTYVKSNVLEGIVIDSTDVKYLPREECQKPDTKIWKIAMWGGMNDWELMIRLNKNYSTIKSLFKKENVDYGVGFETSSPANKPNCEIKNLPIHTPNNILKYYTPTPSKRINAEKFRRLGKVEAYQTSHIIINEGIKVENDQLTLSASFVDYKSAYSKGIVGVYSKNGDTDLLKLLTIYLNSDFVRYYSFLVTSSWGIERDVVKHQELFEAPFILDKLSDEQKKELVALFDNELFDTIFSQLNTRVEAELNRYILNCLSENDQYIIQHLLNNIDLFHKQENSKTLYPVSQNQITEYGEMICKELNDFLDGQNLYANATVYNVSPVSPLMMIKLSHEDNKKDIVVSDEKLDKELKKLDVILWKEETKNIYFRKKLNYYDGDDIFIIRPNQRRFWSQSMAMEDASELILEILNEK